jgi:nitroreductase
MDAIEAIMTRRSIRKYAGKRVAPEAVEKLLRAAMAAPSAGNQQPWHFIVVWDRATLDAIPEFHPYSKMLHDASVAIVVCGDMESEVHAGYWVQDCSAATQNMLVAAHALGLGAVWLGIYPTDERVASMRDLLHMPSNVVPLAVIALGHPAERATPADRYNPERVHEDRW